MLTYDWQYVSKSYQEKQRQVLELLFLILSIYIYNLKQ